MCVFILLFEQQQLVTTSRLNDISESSNLYVVCEWSEEIKKKKEAHTQNPFGSGGFCASGRFVFEYCNTCMRIYWIHAYAEVRDQQAQTICERKAIWLLATATYCMSVTHSYSTTSIDTIIHSHSILYSICACTGVCVCVQLDVCSLSSIYEHTTDKTTK